VQAVYVLFTLECSEFRKKYIDVLGSARWKSLRNTDLDQSE